MSNFSKLFIWILSFFKELFVWKMLDCRDKYVKFNKKIRNRNKAGFHLPDLCGFYVKEYFTKLMYFFILQGRTKCNKFLLIQKLLLQKIYPYFFQ